jgi:hypothetical protein
MKSKGKDALKNSFQYGRIFGFKFHPSAVKASEAEAKKVNDKHHVLLILKFINQFFDDNPLASPTTILMSGSFLRT